MYAVIKSGGKQYKVKVGDSLKIEKVTKEEQDKIYFDKVLMLAINNEVRIGDPYLEEVKVVGDILRNGRGKKIRIIKFKRRKNSLKRMGHRQDFTEVKISAIEV